MKFLTSIDLSQNEIQNAIVQPLATAPANPKLGQIYYNSTEWKPVGKSYELPAATKDKLGGVKIGSRMSVAADGTVSADKQTDNNLTDAMKQNYDAAYQHSQASHAPTDAQKNVQSDWNATDAKSDAFIKNKPKIPSKAADVGAIPATEKGTAGGVAELDSGGKVPANQLPSYVDDVVDAYIRTGATALGADWLSKTSGGAALTPESDKIYVILSEGKYQNKTYRWSGTTYAPVGNDLALGETASTAYWAKMAAGVKNQTAKWYKTDKERAAKLDAQKRHQ